MPDDIYEIIALAARYWFLLLMLLIAWRSYRWYARDRKKHKRSLKLLPDAGYIGELVVVEGDDIVRRGTCLPVGREGVLGYLRSNDVCVPAGGIANRHLWFAFDDTDGLRVEPLRGRMIVADGKELIGKRMRAYLAHGSTLVVGQAKMRLRMFSGFEFAGEMSAHRKPLDEPDENGISGESEGAPDTARVRRMREIADWQQMQEAQDAEDTQHAFYPPETDDGADSKDADEDEDANLPPVDDANPSSYELEDGSQVFYPPVADGAETELPKSEYVDGDEAERAKRAFWDKYLGGGKKR